MNSSATVRLALIADFDASYDPHLATETALRHSAAELRTDLQAYWLPTNELAAEDLSNFDGLFIAPGSPYRDLEAVLAAIRWAREGATPCLGTCGGFQHIIIEYARNVLGVPEASHGEYETGDSPLFIHRLDCSLARRTLRIQLRQDSLAARCYGATEMEETYYCNFGVNPQFAKVLLQGRLEVVGSDAEGEVRVVEYPEHPFFVGTLFVPQMRSTKAQPHPLVSAFVAEAVQRAKKRHD